MHFTRFELSRTVSDLVSRLGLGLGPHCLGLGLGLEPHCLGLGLGLEFYVSYTSLHVEKAILVYAKDKDFCAEWRRLSSILIEDEEKNHTQLEKRLD